MDREMKNAVAMMKQGAPKAKPAKRKTICNGCRFANWDKTASGKLHPSGYGRCAYTADYAVPASHNGSWTQGRNGMFEVRGGGIHRTDTVGSTWLSACAVREPAE